MKRSILPISLSLAFAVLVGLGAYVEVRQLNKRLLAQVQAFAIERKQLSEALSDAFAATTRLPMAEMEIDQLKAEVASQNEMYFDLYRRCDAAEKKPANANLRSSVRVAVPPSHFDLTKAYESIERTSQMERQTKALERAASAIEFQSFQPSQPSRLFRP